MTMPTSNIYIYRVKKSEKIKEKIHNNNEK